MTYCLGGSWGAISKKLRTSWPTMLSGGEGTPVRVLGGRVQLLCSGSFDGPPLKEAFNGDDEAALGIGRAGLRPPLGSLQPCGIRP